MNDHVYKQLELTGSSSAGMENAINNAIGRASKTLHRLKWFEVVNVRGNIADGAVSHWQVTLKVGMTLDD